MGLRVTKSITAILIFGLEFLHFYPPYLPTALLMMVNAFKCCTCSWKGPSPVLLMCIDLSVLMVQPVLADFPYSRFVCLHPCVRG